MRVNILSIMGFIMLAALLILGFFGFPIGFFICALLGLSYGIAKKDKPFIKWSSLILILDILFIVFFWIRLPYM